VFSENLYYFVQGKTLDWK